MAAADSHNDEASIEGFDGGGLESAFDSDDDDSSTFPTMAGRGRQGLRGANPGASSGTNPNPLRAALRADGAPAVAGALAAPRKLAAGAAAGKRGIGAIAARARRSALDASVVDAATAAQPTEEGLPPDLLWSSDEGEEGGASAAPGRAGAVRGAGKRERVVAKAGTDGSVPPRFLGPRGWTGLLAAVTIAVCVWCAPMADTLALSLMCVSVGPGGVSMAGLGSVTPPDDSSTEGSLRASSEPSDGGSVVPRNVSLSGNPETSPDEELTIKVLLFDLGTRCDAPAVVGLQLGFAGPLLLALLVGLPIAMLLSLPSNFPLLARLYRCTSGIGREL